MNEQDLPSSTLAHLRKAIAGARQRGNDARATQLESIVSDYEAAVVARAALEESLPATIGARPSEE